MLQTEIEKNAKKVELIYVHNPTLICRRQLLNQVISNFQ
jgi:hypothetical protein